MRGKLYIFPSREFSLSQESWPGRQAAKDSARNWDEHLLVARTPPGQNMQGEQDRVGDFSEQSDCPDSGQHA